MVNNDKKDLMHNVFHFSAPEILLHREYDSSIDLWSLGVVTYIMQVFKIIFCEY